MSKHPVQRGRRALRELENDAVEVIRPADSFFAFRYSYTEVSAARGKARIKSRQMRLQDGRLATETFEGDTDRAVGDRLIEDTQRHFLGQLALVAKSLSWWLPSSRDPRSERD